MRNLKTNELIRSIAKDHGVSTEQVKTVLMSVFEYLKYNIICYTTNYSNQTFVYSMKTFMVTKLSNKRRKINQKKLQSMVYSYSMSSSIVYK